MIRFIWRWNVKFAFDWYKTNVEKLRRESEIMERMKSFREMSDLRMKQWVYHNLWRFVDSYTKAKWNLNVGLKKYFLKSQLDAFMKWKEVN